MKRDTLARAGAAKEGMKWKRESQGYEKQSVWGLVAYLVGVTLLSLGYVQLAREANPLLSNGQVLNE